MVWPGFEIAIYRSEHGCSTNCAIQAGFTSDTHVVTYITEVELIYQYLDDIAVPACFYVDVVECLISDTSAWVRFPTAV